MRLLWVVGALALAGCASPAERIGRSLVRVGVPFDVAQCMGFRLQQRLTIGQLRQLDRLARLDNRGGLGRARLQDIGRVLGPDDPELVSEVVRVGVGCMI